MKDAFFLCGRRSNWSDTLRTLKRVSAPGEGGNMPLVAVDLGCSPNQLSVALTLKWLSSLVMISSWR